MSRIDNTSLRTLIDQAVFGNQLGLADILNRTVFDSHTSNRYPPSNISMTDENHWLIEFAVAGFSEKDLSVTLLKNNLLQVTGSIESSDKDELKKEPTYLKRGIGLRSFTETFQLAEYTSVIDVSLVNGLLKISIERVVPEEAQPKKLTIKV